MMHITSPKTIIIVDDDRIGENGCFTSMDDFRQTMLACDDYWMENFDEFMEHENPEVHEAELVRQLADSGIYTYTHTRNMGYGRYQTVHIYYRAYPDGSIRFLVELNKPATDEELDEIVNW